MQRAVSWITAAALTLMLQKSDVLIKGFGRPGSFCFWVSLCPQLFTHRNLLNGVPNTNEGIGCDFFLQNSVEIRIEEKGEKRVKSIQKSEFL